jgi:hypothetical protein
VTDRLNSTDEMLYHSGANLGSWRVVQVLWRFSSEVPASALRAEWERLNRGRLSRQVTPSAVPGARRRWVSASNQEPLHVDVGTLDEADVIAWMDAQVRALAGVGSTSLWRLASARFRGGTLVSLTVPHYRSDGLGLFAALEARHCPGTGRGPSTAGLLWSDLGDALGQTVLAVAGSADVAARTLLDMERRSSIRAALRRRPPAPASSGPRHFSTAIFELDASSWEEAAGARGGTVNSLFVEIAANLVRTRVPRDEAATIQVGIPMSLRGSPDDGRANALVVVPAEVPAGAPRHEGLRDTREVVKAALATSGADSVTLVPEPLWHLLPRRYADRLKVPGAQQTDVVASNFGVVPDVVICFAGRRADSVVLRTMNVPGLVPERARLRATLCLLQVGDRMTLTATGMPDHFGDAECLRGIVGDELASWGLRSERWC